MVAISVAKSIQETLHNNNPEVGGDAMMKKDLQDALGVQRGSYPHIPFERLYGAEDVFGNHLRYGTNNMKRKSSSHSHTHTHGNPGYSPYYSENIPNENFVSAPNFAGNVSKRGYIEDYMRTALLRSRTNKERDKSFKSSTKSYVENMQTDALLARNKELEARLRANNEKMLEEERKLADKSMNVKESALVKDTIPIADVENNGLNFEHHNELLRRKLNMIQNDQNNIIRNAKIRANIHRARSNTAPDTLIASDPGQFSAFVSSGPAMNLSLEIPVDVIQQ